MLSTGQAPVGGLGDEVPQKLKLFAHLHIIFSIFSPMQDLDSTDFCNSKFGTLASRGPWAPGPFLYPPLQVRDSIAEGTVCTWWCVNVVNIGKF